MRFYFLNLVPVIPCSSVGTWNPLTIFSWRVRTKVTSHHSQCFIRLHSDAHPCFRFDDAPHSSHDRSLNETSSTQRSLTTPVPGSAKNMRISASYSPNIAAAVMTDSQPPVLRGAFKVAATKSKSHEVFDESGNAVPMTKNLPVPSSFTAQLLPGKLMQYPDGTVKSKKHSMYA